MKKSIYTIYFFDFFYFCFERYLLGYESKLRE